MPLGILDGKEAIFSKNQRMSKELRALAAFSSGKGRFGALFDCRAFLEEVSNIRSAPHAFADV
jgi:hypothetical protein